MSNPASNLREIEERCSKVFEMPEFRLIAWVGVFGSFSDGGHTARSDIDLLVGFKGGTSDDEIYYMADLEEPLNIATKRDIDILFMDNNEPPSFVKAQSLLTGKTIYETGTWL